jgi:hypothetical protein
MKKILCLAICSLVIAAAARADSSLGFGIRAFRTVDDLEKPFKENGLGGYVNWRAQLTEWVGGQLEFAVYEDGFAGSREEVVGSQAFLVLGRAFYGAIGGGYLYSDGDLADSPYLAARLGVQGALTTWFLFDVSLTYETAAWEGINEFDERFDSDTVVLGAGLRMLF